jgi:large subunit ribosomal protein L21
VGSSSTDPTWSVAPQALLTGSRSGADRKPVNEELGLEVVYAIVRAGGRQEKVEVGTVLVVDRQKPAEDGTLTFAPVLLVDGETVTHAAADLAKVTVTAELVNNERGKKIVIQKFKNKTGYKKRQGHRQDLSRVRITAIG